MPNLNNTYVPGSGVGASNIANRRAKLIRATSCTGIFPCYRLGLTNATVPNPPTNVTLTNISPNLVRVNFNAPINTGGSPILSYKITCTPVGRPDIIISPKTTTSLSMGITLPQGVSYTITVIATNAFGNSSSSSTSSPSSITPLTNLTNTTEFTTPGSITWTAPDTATSVSYLVVGGGGGGGGAYDNSGGGGGGGGLVLTGTMDVTPGQTYNVTVGTGGAGAIRPTYISGQGPSVNTMDGSSGNSSSFDVIVAGGGGFGYKSRTTGGGGLQASGNTPPTGGNGGGGGLDGGGGGGNGSSGSSSDGGDGITSNISGTLTTYGAGGGGGFNATNSSGTDGEANTGNGGQGGGSLSGNNIGGANGGSGIVIIKFNT
jgi:hypothetical protein